MRTSYLCFISLFSIPLLGMAAEQPSPVRDIEGNYVRAGVGYYILPVIRGRGGGLTLAPTGNKTCPMNVVQEQSEVKNGLPLTFHPAVMNLKKGVVRVLTDNNIKFSAMTTCVQSTVWALEHDETSGEYLITTGGVEGNPGRETVGSWFKIDEYEGSYKLRFCPTVCNYCKVICRDVGVLVQDKNKRVLGLTNKAPFRVMFKKA